MRCGSFTTNISTSHALFYDGVCACVLCVWVCDECAIVRPFISYATRSRNDDNKMNMCAMRCCVNTEILNWTCVRCPSVSEKPARTKMCITHLISRQKKMLHARSYGRWNWGRLGQRPYACASVRRREELLSAAAAVMVCLSWCCGCILIRVCTSLSFPFYLCARVFYSFSFWLWCFSRHRRRHYGFPICYQCWKLKKCKKKKRKKESRWMTSSTV